MIYAPGARNPRAATGHHKPISQLVYYFLALVTIFHLCCSGDYFSLPFSVVYFCTAFVSCRQIRSIVMLHSAFCVAKKFDLIFEFAKVIWWSC